MGKQHFLNRFWLIQEGKVIRDPNIRAVIDLCYMGAAEFEFNACEYSFIRMISKRHEYNVYLTGIVNPQGRELVLYCNKNEHKRILKLIKKFVNKPYYLKSFSRLPDVPKGQNGAINFWWCIDNMDDIGDWMLFFENDADLILDSFREDYHKRWVPLDDELKEKLFTIARRGYQ